MKLLCCNFYPIIITFVLLFNSATKIYVKMKFLLTCPLYVSIRTTLINICVKKYLSDQEKIRIIPQLDSMT